MIPKRLAKSKTAKAVYDTFGCEFTFEKNDNKTMVVVKMIKVSSTLIMNKREFKNLYSMNYECNLNHAFKPGVKEEVTSLIIKHNPALEIEDITFDARGCEIIEEEEDPLDISSIVGFPMKLCVEKDEGFYF